MDSTFVAILDIAKEAAISAKDIFTQIAPEIWQMARMKVLAESAGNFITASIVSFVLYCVMLKLYKVCMEEGDDEVWVAYILAGGAVTLAVGSWFSIALYIIITRVVALDYYTLMAITELIK